MCLEIEWAPVNYNTQLLISADKCVLIENPLGGEFTEEQN